MKTLVIVAHPDDEALSCGGLIQNRVTRHDDVFVLCVFKRFYPTLSGEAQMAQDEIDQSAFHMSLETLGHENNAHLEGSMLGYPEGEPHSLSYYSLLLPIEKRIRAFRPDEVVIPSPDDLNQDHRFLHEICKIALRSGNMGGVFRILMWHAHDGGTPPGANWFETMTDDQLLLKQGAVERYPSEMRPLPHPRSPSNIEAHARVCGSMVAEEFAEPFTLYKGKFT
jgi:LmbE family N-acetylglucosaminyl deacetylase